MNNTQMATSSFGNYFNNKTCIITGASSGIGEALATALASEGANIILAARNLEKLKKITLNLKQVSPNAKITPVKTDVTSEKACINLIEKSISLHGEINIVINNAGISMRGRAELTDIPVFKKLIETNYYPLVYLYHHSYKHLAKSSGHFAVISSLQSKMAMPERSGYSASKHAVRGFIDSVRIEAKKDKIHIMSVDPGYVNTTHSINALTTSGKQHNRLDTQQQKGLPPSFVAMATLEGLKKKKREISPSGIKEKGGSLIKKVSPALFDRIIASYQPNKK